MMKMRNYVHTITYMAVCLFVLSACGSEDALEADFRNPSDFFMPAGDDQSEEAQLRRQFFNETGCYLLFNDTIQKEYLGTDINGAPVYSIETVDLTYSVGMSAYISTHYSYSYLSTWEQRRQVVSFLSDFVLPHLTGALKPYSWFVCNQINSWTNENQNITHPFAALNQRCIAISGNYIIQQQRTDAQKQNYAQRILNVIIGQLATNKSEAFAEFYTFSADYYNRDYSAMGYVSKPGTADLYALGFLSSTGFSNFPSATVDLSSYALLVVQYDENQLATMYGSYPLILQKAAIVRSVLIDLGYVF